MDDFTVCRCVGDVAARMQRAAAIADRAAVAEIECEGVAETIAGVTWYDIRPMVDPRETSAESIDLAKQVIDHAIDRRLVIRHPTHPHLVRMAKCS